MHMYEVCAVNKYGNARHDFLHFSRFIHVVVCFTAALLSQFVASVVDSALCLRSRFL